MSTMGGGDFGPKFESVPEKFSVVVDEGIDVIELTKRRQMEWAVCVDLSSGKLYIGKGHGDILHRYPIPEAKRCTAAAKFNGPEDVTVTIFDYAFGAPRRPIEPDVLKNRIVAALRQDILKTQG